MMAGGIGMLLFWALVIVVIVLLARGSMRGRLETSSLQSPRSGPAPFDILQERYAKGEISKEEYLERKKMLQEWAAIGSIAADHYSTLLKRNDY